MERILTRWPDPLLYFAPITRDQSHQVRSGNNDSTLVVEVWKWAQSSYDHKVSFRLKGTRESVIKHLQTQYNLFGTMPDMTKVKLPSSADESNLL